MPKLRRRNSNPQAAGHAPLRSSLSNAALAVEDRVVLGAGGLAEAVKWPFERIAWAVEHWLVWPIQEETALWSRLTKGLVGGGLIVLAGGAVAAGIALSDPSSTEPVATLSGPQPPTVAAAAATHGSAAAAKAPSGPVLHGTAPSFAPESGEKGVPKSSEAEVLRSESGPKTGAEAVKTTGANGAAPGADVAAPGPEVAGPAAIKVAREFSNAFVLYEVGNDSPEVKKAIAATASPDLTKALLRRAPRQPSNVKVPKAKVLNIVVGPTEGSTYTLSVSLLRARVTSELRIDMKQVPGGGSTSGGGPGGKENAGAAQKKWQVTDVLG
jgi:hypothetical protein